MGSLIPLAGRTELAPRRQAPLTTTSRQRSQALRSLAHLLIEACGMAMREVGDDIE